MHELGSTTSSPLERQLTANFLTRSLLNLIEKQPSQILTTISIEKPLKVELYRKQQVLPLSSYSHMVSSGTVPLLSQVTNLMAFAKNLRHSTLTSEDELRENLTELIESYIIGKSQNAQEFRLLKCFLEQIDLLFKSKLHHRRYSPLLLVVMIFLVSLTK